MGAFESTTAGGGLAKEEREEVGAITGPPPTPSISLPTPVLSEGAMRVFEGIPAGGVCDCVHVSFTCMCTDWSVQKCMQDIGLSKQIQAHGQFFS